MKQILLSLEEILDGYDAVSELYPYIPPMCIWRAWEYASYRHYKLPEPVIDIGCGDGGFFRLIWPGIHDVVGIDINVDVANAARLSGVYREVHLSPAHQLPVVPESFASAFANCSLEHMDNLSSVLASVHQSVRPFAPFLLSVVTDKILEWATLPLLLKQFDERAKAQALQDSYETYHHLVNPFPLEVWVRYLEDAGFEVVEHIPIVPEMTSRLFLLLDYLWHVRRGGGEVGDLLHPYLMRIPNFPHAFRQVVSGVLQMERDWSTGCGAIFSARRKG